MFDPGRALEPARRAQRRTRPADRHHRHLHADRRQGARRDAAWTGGASSRPTGARGTRRDGCSRLRSRVLADLADAEASCGTPDTLRAALDAALAAASAKEMLRSNREFRHSVASRKTEGLGRSSPEAPSMPREALHHHRQPASSFTSFVVEEASVRRTGHGPITVGQRTAHGRGVRQGLATSDTNAPCSNSGCSARSRSLATTVLTARRPAATGAPRGAAPACRTGRPDGAPRRRSVGR